MDFPRDQVDELQQCFPGVKQHDEGGYTYFFLPNITLPPSCTPQRVDALLCPMMRDGYPSRLFFSQAVTTSENRNWNGSSRILERMWYAISWRIDEVDLRLAQMIEIHLSALYERAPR